ncbi:aminoglycoside phosphotransferase [Amycolatopsis sp. K13G38]|uniref:Aminoglycoside phosphotransferase n=1 Tax=Amycolatopsis acididurans TaxID=2724524 RepID=A0ABX1JHV6_9PSEU|nr:aminoglycoside phosphotransferase [Amycolatopsis acididurans]
MAGAFSKAAAEAGATVAGEPVFGWRERTIGAPVDTPDGPRWLRVVSEHHRWAEGDFWTGNADAATITGVAKPRLLGCWEWHDGDYRLRAEVMTIVPGRHCSATPELHEPLPLPDLWWRELRGSLYALAQVDTVRVHVSQADVAHRIRVFFGDRVTDPTVSSWSAAHTDLHWANLMAPGCALVDWEGWGMAPAGFDAATLYLHSLLVPEMADRVVTAFSAQLQARDGLLSQLFVTGRMLLRINSGDYPELAIPLHRNAERVIEVLTRR